MHLESRDLDQHIFSQMINLEELDLSQNALSELPDNLNLNNLRVFNFSDNHVEDITVLKQFPNLEEVMYEDNIYLTVSDNYKVFCLLPKLRRLNNKDITSLANHVRFVNHRELSSRVESYWENQYKNNLPEKPSIQKIKAVGKDFIKTVTDHVKYGPNSLKDFVRWKEFFTLAWTTLTMVGKNGQKRKINILAGGGKCGVVRVIHTKVNLCYGEIKAHKKAISIMAFSPKQETFLFTGSYDKRIILWDIGVPDCEYNFRASQLLTLDTTDVPLRICLVPSCPDEYLLAACEDGCFAWDIRLDKKQGRRSCEIEFNFPIYKEEGKEKDFHVIDSLTFLNKDIIASKSAMQGSIYLWSWEKSLKTQKSKSNKKLDAAILGQMKWSSTEIPYLVLNSSPGPQMAITVSSKQKG
ncbi:hypothetical protein GDO86_003133 [Hymenochirus boettgeri]|uniref:Leucine-rich repeat and WD repeat-containing protein 1 n=1 Tax=Hymenochirus boettgeri TaxID=247094 RepID=A0A8T2K537_9PIPI|nr:hypothetical protein GDO86_003133 [Hymenochirus boettgeri]